MAVDILRLNKKDIDKIVLVGGKSAKTAQVVVNSLSEKPDYIINAGHFDNSTKSKFYGMTITDTIVENEWINGGNYNNINENQGLAWNNINDICLKTTYTTNQMQKDWRYYLGGSPCLIKNGSLNIDKYLNSSFAVSKTKRIAVGVSDNQIIFYFPLGNSKIKPLATKLQSYGCKNAICLDGGGSQYVGQVKNGKVTHLDNNKQNRPVSTWFCIYMKKTTKKENPFPRVYKVTANWVNMRTEPNISSHIHKTIISSGRLKKGDRITVFEIVYNDKEKRYWAKSYGYYVALEYLKEV